MNFFSRSNFQKIGMFFKKNGFYIALFVCVAGLGIAAVFTLTFSEPNTDNANEEKAKDVQNIQAPRLSDEISQKEAVSPPPALTPTADATSSNLPQLGEGTAATETQKPSAKPKTQTLVMPVKGEIIRPFSVDKLVYNKTLNQWATHNGVDIKPGDDDSVLAALSGTVTKIYDDPVSGNVVVIKHENGDLSLYAGLAIDPKLEEGLKLNTGEKLGTVKTPPFEEFLGPHLHFEYMSGSEYKDPEKLFKK